LATAASRRDLENSESRIAICRAARFHVVFKIGAERFCGDSELYSLSTLDEFNRSSTP
jgi:hypothetical protein